MRHIPRPDLSAPVADLDTAGAVLVVGAELVDEAPILDLRVRKAVRRRGVPLVVATSRPSSLDPNAAVVLRYAPGAEEAALGALATEFLQRELERREAVGEAQAARDADRLAALLREVRADAAALESTLAEHLDAEAWESARDVVRELRFLIKIAGDIEAAISEVES